VHRGPVGRVRPLQPRCSPCPLWRLPVVRDVSGRPAELSPYKYAGYLQLVETIRAETERPDLFARPPALLDAAARLCLRTIQCSPLNAEQLGREGGLLVGAFSVPSVSSRLAESTAFQTLSSCLARCTSVVGGSSKEADLVVQVCASLMRTFEASCKFALCLDKVQALEASFFAQIVHLLKFTVSQNGAGFSSVRFGGHTKLLSQHLVSLVSAVCDCVSAMSVNGAVQSFLLDAGALWYLLPFLFQYDFTLDESGVEKTADQNQQVVHLNSSLC